MASQVFRPRSDPDLATVALRGGTAPGLPADPGWDRAVQQPVFVVGAPRSGTTLLRLMLGHHPRVAFLSEFPFAVDALPERGWPPLGGYYEYLAENRIFRDSGLKIDTGLDYVGLMQSFLRQALRRGGLGSGWSGRRSTTASTG
jgi:hypothetical protein